MPGLASAPIHSTVVMIGGTPVRVSTGDSGFLGVNQKRYEGFLDTDLRASIHLRVDLVPPGKVSTEEQVRVSRNDGAWRAERSDFRLDWDAQTGAGSVRQSANPYSLDAVLRILHTLTLAREGGFLLHAASAIRNGRACLFFGPSGAGKTTLARMAPKDAILLSDEISYIRREGGQYVACGTPFAGELAKAGENVSAPIAAFYHLVQARQNRVVEMSHADAVRALLESLLFFAEDADLVKQVFETACEVVCRLPVRQLEFTRSTDVWELIE